MKINWKVRLKNPVFVFQIVLAILTPILAYAGLGFSDITTWHTLGDLIQQAYSNPYLLGLVIISLFNATTDPTTNKLSDSPLAMSYKNPKDNRDRFK